VTGVRIAVIGVGPRGLSVVERVISHASAGGRPVELLLVEPGELGVGIHRLDQPDYLLLNTICSQLTGYSDPAMVAGAPATEGPSFFQWCRAHHGDVRFDDFLPRRLLGEYLRSVAADLLERAPRSVTLTRHRTVATDVRPAHRGARVRLADGTTLAVDLAVVTTGHGLPRTGGAPAAGVRLHPYPLPAQVDGVPAGATVALLGAGLTAMDMIAALTLGRGGRYDGSRSCYHPSGREPRIVLVNRCGWWPCARPATRPDRRAAPAFHLTPDAVAALRAATPDGRLDFRGQVEPLVRREVHDRMAEATPVERAAVAEILDPRPRRWPDAAAYERELLDRARADLREAERGLGVSRVKEGLEVLRDHRDALRAAVDSPGLTETSHRYFMDTYTALVNRVVIGPQKERIAELLALVEAGVVRPGPGPAARIERRGAGWTVVSTRFDRPLEQRVDDVLPASVNWPERSAEHDPVGESLRGWAAAGPGGDPCLALDRDGYAVARDGHTGRPAVAVFGPPAEGSSYYNHYVPSPGVWSRALTDLDRVLAPALACLAGVDRDADQQ
jgi:hypothetical protein